MLSHTTLRQAMPCHLGLHCPALYHAMPCYAQPTPQEHAHRCTRHLGLERRSLAVHRKSPGAHPCACTSGAAPAPTHAARVTNPGSTTIIIIIIIIIIITSVIITICRIIGNSNDSHDNTGTYALAGGGNAPREREQLGTRPRRSGFRCEPGARAATYFYIAPAPRYSLSL